MLKKVFTFLLGVSTPKGLKSKTFGVRKLPTLDKSLYRCKYCYFFLRFAVLQLIFSRFSLLLSYLKFMFNA